LEAVAEELVVEVEVGTAVGCAVAGLPQQEPVERRSVSRFVLGCVIQVVAAAGGEPNGGSVVAVVGGYGIHLLLPLAALPSADFHLVSAAAAHPSVVDVDRRLVVSVVGGYAAVGLTAADDLQAVVAAGLKSG